MIWVNHPKFFKQFKDGTRPKNDEQILAYHMLVDPKIILLNLFGGPGGGKTLLPIQAGISQLGKVFDQITIFRANEDMGRPLGSVPGDEGEKGHQWGKAIFSNLKTLSENKKKKTGKGFSDFIVQGKIQIQMSNSERGNTRNRELVIIDDVQNFKPKVIKGLISRAGKGTKYVLTGDVDESQKDNLDLIGKLDGLSRALKVYPGTEGCAQLMLARNERSYLSSLAAMM